MGKGQESNLKTLLDIPPSEIEKYFPNLRLDNHHGTSIQEAKYNCHAWAVHIDNDHWGPYKNLTWPLGAPRNLEYEKDDVDYFIKGFQALGFKKCCNGKLKKGFEKIALYINNKSVEHTARQLPNGHWTSKLGINYDDIEHYTLEALENGEYGKVLIFMKRKINE